MYTSWAEYPILTSLNQGCPSLSSYLPHTRWMMEEAFAKWQQLTVLETDNVQTTDPGNKSLVNNTHPSKAGMHLTGDAKQPFRAEKRYRRR